MSHAVQRHFDRLSQRYSQNFAPGAGPSHFGFAKRIELVTALVHDSSGSLLDCACGTGEVSACALRAGSFTRAVLVDLSSKMLERAASQRSDLACPDVQFCQSDIFAYHPASKADFDVILCLGLVAHTGELPRLLAHLKTLLGRDGRILLQTSLASHLGVRIVRRVAGNRFDRRAGYRLSYFTLADIAAACVESGLVVEQVRRYCFGLPFGDAVFATGNYYLEKALAPLAARVGAEAICVLGHAR
jgi:ubiquinone/menaquinone biosynthesis C-methylase UbiE